MNRKADTLVQIDAATARIPSFTCKPGCTECCGPVLMTRAEHFRILAARGGNGWPIVKPGTITCGLLTDSGRCSVYEIRPAVCRLFGAARVERLQCPVGCGPEKPISAVEAGIILKTVERLGGALS